MKILVCISNVPDTTTKVTFTDNNTQLITNGVQFILNPYDEIALAKAIELIEGDNGSVTVIHVLTNLHHKIFSCIAALCNTIKSAKSSLSVYQWGSRGGTTVLSLPPRGVRSSTSSRRRPECSWTLWPSHSTRRKRSIK